MSLTALTYCWTGARAGTSTLCGIRPRVSSFQRFIGNRAFRSAFGAMAAIVILWVCVPMLISAIRTRIRL